jgi:hypothetical protein
MRKKLDFFSYSSDMWALDVIGFLRNMELYQMFLGGATPRWSYSTVELLHSGIPWIYNSRAIFSEMELCKTLPEYHKCSFCQGMSHLVLSS